MIIQTANVNMKWVIKWLNVCHLFKRLWLIIKAHLLCQNGEKNPKGFDKFPKGSSNFTFVVIAIFIHIFAL